MRRHPQLAKKLSLLYSLRLNPTIKSHADLASVLGISRQAVGKWTRGTETSYGDSIPLAQVENVSAIFDISEHWFSLELEEFEAKLYAKLEAESRLDSKRPNRISVSLMPTTPAKIYGRKGELKFLDSEWGGRRSNVLQIIAFGGMGKSSLVNAWLSRLDQKGYCGARRVYAWSFYWQGAKSEVRSSGDYFIEHALNWFGDQAPSEGSPWDKASRLAELIRMERTLLILDGLEPMQYPPGPKHGEVENPAVALLIKELASENNGLCVITSRLPVTDLATYEGARTTTIDLVPLSVKAGIKMLKGIGIQGFHTEYAEAVNDYEGHPLSLSLLGGYLNVVHQSKMGEYKKIRSLLDEQSMGFRAKNLMQNYLNWFQGTPERALIFMVGMFDRAVSIEDIKIISEENPNITDLTNELSRLNDIQFSYAVDRLRQANLILQSEINGVIFLDCHPLVRDFVSDFLIENYQEMRRLGHSLIFYYLQKTAIANPESMAELEPLFRAVIHGTRAGLYEEAFEVYFERIKKKQFSMFTQGSHHEDQVCIRSFFLKEWEEPVSELPDTAKFYLLSCTATNLIYLGEVTQAIELCVRSINWFKKQGLWLDALNIAAPLASMFIMIGELDNAISLIRDLQYVIKKTENQVIEAMGWCFQAHALHLNGDDLTARELFEKSEEILTSKNPVSPISFPTVSSYYCKFLLETGNPKQALDRSLLTFSWRRDFSWQVALDTTSLLASDMQILGLSFLELGDYVNAKINLDKQVELLREADEWLYLPSGLNARARLSSRLKKYDEAISDLETALSISRRTGAKLGEWESLLDLSHLYFEIDNLRDAEKYLRQALKIPGMEAYRFRQDEIRELSKKIERRKKNKGNVSQEKTGKKEESF